MDKKDFSDLEEQIRITVENAFNSIDFTGIKNDIREKTEGTINDVKTTLKNTSQDISKKMENAKKNTIKIKKNTNKELMYISKKPVGKISGIIYMIFGTIGATILGILLIIQSIFVSIWSGMSIINGISLGVLLSFFVGSILLTLKGVGLRKRVRRFKQYVACLKGQNYCLIRDLANAVQKQEKFVIKDLKKMSSLGMFKESYIDDEQTYFMLSNEVYENYLSSKETLRKRKEEDLKRQEQLKEEINDPQKKELRETIENGKYYIDEIKVANDCIPEEEFSQKLYRLEKVIIEIFKYIEKNPKKLSEVSKFINHYLPMTLKLVNAYKELNNQPVQGANIKTAKNEIEKSIDMINTAFEKLLDDLFEDIVWDISSDISVLETLFTQEGLTKNDFEK